MVIEFHDGTLSHERWVNGKRGWGKVCLRRVKRRWACNWENEHHPKLSFSTDIIPNTPSAITFLFHPHLYALHLYVSSIRRICLLLLQTFTKSDWIFSFSRTCFWYLHPVDSINTATFDIHSFWVKWLVSQENKRTNFRISITFYSSLLNLNRRRLSPKIIHPRVWDVIIR